MKTVQRGRRSNDKQKEKKTKKKNVSLLRAFYIREYSFNPFIQINWKHKQHTSVPNPLEYRCTHKLNFLTFNPLI